MISEPSLRIGDTVRFQLDTETGTATITAIDMGANVPIISIPLRILSASVLLTLSNGKIVNGLQVTKV